MMDTAQNNIRRWLISLGPELIEDVDAIFILTFLETIINNSSLNQR